MVTHASVASSKPKVDLDSHADMYIAGDNCLVIQDHYRPVNVYRYDLKYGYKSAKTVDATVDYQDPQSGQSFIFIKKPCYPHRWTSQPSLMPNAVSHEWHANQLSM